MHPSPAGGLLWSGCTMPGLSPEAWHEFAYFHACVAASFRPSWASLQLLAPFSDFPLYLDTFASMPLQSVHGSDTMRQVSHEPHMPALRSYCEPFSEFKNKPLKSVGWPQVFSAGQRRPGRHFSSPATVCADQNRRKDLHAQLAKLDLLGIDIKDIARRALGGNANSTMQEALSLVTLASACAPLHEDQYIAL
jgi:hypothetical protein